jgi:hypothetical protein
LVDFPKQWNALPTQLTLQRQMNRLFFDEFKMMGASSLLRCVQALRRVNLANGAWASTACSSAWCRGAGMVERKRPCVVIAIRSHKLSI